MEDFIMNTNLIEKNWTIDMIQKIMRTEAEAMAEEKIKIKEHDCFIIDFGGYFGYSVLVFNGDKHIYYANDYELHNKYTLEESGKQGLRKYYIEEMQRKLFTDTELMESVKSYNEYNRKNYFLRNYWIMRYNHISWFGKADDETIKKLKTEYIYDCKVCFCYVSDKNIINDAAMYCEHLDREFEKLKNDNDVFKEMISHELANHEACITCDYTEALNSLGMSFDELSEDKQKIVIDELHRQIHEY